MKTETFPAPLRLDTALDAAGLLSRPAGMIVSLMHSRTVSPVEIVEVVLRRIEEVNPGINAVVALRSGAARAEAKRAEARIAEGRARRLEGLPFTVKDTIETGDLPTTAGTRSLVGHMAKQDAPVVARMRAAGAILLGKTNCAELAMTYCTDNVLFGETKNPWNLDLTPGGSSGGEAAIIAAKGSYLGLGSDLGGSIRAPASFCRIAGLRPTLNRLPPHGHVPVLPQPFGGLSVIGPMARSAGDLDLAMSALDPSWSLQRRGGSPRRIACYLDDGVVPVASEVRVAVESAVELLSRERKERITVDERPPPAIPELYQLWDDLWDAAGGARGLLAPYLDHATELSPQLVRLVESSSGERDEVRLASATERLRQIRERVEEFMKDYPAIICPVAAGPPTERVGRWTIDGVDIRGARGFGYCYVWSLLGCPAVAQPMGETGVQIVARPGHDEEAVTLAMEIDRH